LKNLYVPSTPAPVHKKVVLYVEDDPLNREVTRDRLCKKYEVFLASNDIEACIMLNRMQSDLDIILMDIELKGSTLDGLQLVSLLRGKLDRNGIPGYAKQMPILTRPVIILVTAFTERFSKQDILQTGADKLITKPIDFVELEMAMTQMHIQKARNRDIPS